jgi:fumarate reductase subunit C
MRGKEYIRPIPSNWWLKKKAYFWFMVRELTGLCVAGYSLFLLVLLYRLSQGEAAYAGFIQGAKSPLGIALQAIALIGALYHTITFLALTPKVLVVWRGEEKVSGTAIQAVHFAAWAAATIVLGGFVLLATKG